MYVPKKDKFPCGKDNLFEIKANTVISQSSQCFLIRMSSLSFVTAQFNVQLCVADDIVLETLLQTIQSEVFKNEITNRLLQLIELTTLLIICFSCRDLTIDIMGYFASFPIYRYVLW